MNRFYLRIVTVSFLSLVPFARAPFARAGAICLEGPAFRKGSPACWVELGGVCLSRLEWIQWLGDDSPRCGNFVGRFRSISFPVNEPSEAKITLTRFQVTETPGLPRERSWVTRGWKTLEILRERTSSKLAPFDPTGIYRWLLLNERAPELPTATFRLLGLVHLLTAAGIHLYFLARIWDATLRRLCSWLGIPVRWGLPASRALIFFAWVFAWGLMGARLGMLRPWIVVLARQLATMLGFRWRKGAPLAISLAADLVVGALRGNWNDPGRIFYALSVGGGLMGEGRKNHFLLALHSWLLAAVWEAWHTGWIAVATPALSLVSISLYSSIVYPLLLFLPFCGATGTRWIGTWILEPVSDATLLVSHGAMKLSTLWIVSRETFLLGAAFGALVLCLDRFLPRRWICSIAVVAVIGRILSSPAPSTLKPQAHHSALRVEQLDIGQGDAALIRSRDANGRIAHGMIDSGPEKGIRDEGWLQLFSRRGITRLDWIALTHLDADHVAGIHRLARLIPIGCVATSEAQWRSERGVALVEFLRKSGIPAHNFGDPCFPFEFLEPSHVESGKRANANMTAFFVPLATGGFYFNSGDADANAEPRIARWGESLARKTPGLPRILKLNHHGSKTSSTPEFLSALRPSEAWISAGLGNSYGHPNRSVLDRVEFLHIPIRRTDHQGVIRWEGVSKSGPAFH